jgi:8-oxo-dGTP pyrophosphatase MutT (NUDIX family)
VRSDLEALKSKYIPTLGPIQVNKGSDYRYRAIVKRDELENAMKRIVADIDYTNFKNSVAAKEGSSRAHSYAEVWNTLYQLEDDSVPTKRNGKHLAYGGVVFNSRGEVLLRSPKGGYGGDRWTFPKGRPNNGETEEAAALREVREETGYDAKIICALSEGYDGDVTTTYYFVMESTGEPGPFDSETEEVRWVSHSDAIALIDQKDNRKRHRDLAVLKAALKARSAAMTE